MEETVTMVAAGGVIKTAGVVGNVVPKWNSVLSGRVGFAGTGFILHHRRAPLLFVLEMVQFL